MSGAVINDTMLPTFYDFFQTVRERHPRYVLVRGGGGSGKSHSMAQEFLTLNLRYGGLRSLVIQKTFPALRDAAMDNILTRLASWGVPKEHNKTSHEIKLGKGSTIYLRSLDDPEKIKSTEYNLIWLEEATNFTEQDFRQLDLRLRRPGPVFNTMYMTYNPVQSWIVNRLEPLASTPSSRVVLMRSSYLDNPYCSEDYIRNVLLPLKEQNPQLYSIYTLGEPAVLENAVYNNWAVLEQSNWPEHIRSRKNPDVIGLDFGFNDPMVLVDCWFDERSLYLRERLYKTGMTEHDLEGFLRDQGLEQSVTIVGDRSRPDNIEDLNRAGFSVIPSSAKTVKEGIDYLRSLKIYIDSLSTNLIREFSEYSYRKLPDGRVLEEPVKFRDHALDAVRYAVYEMRARGGGVVLPADLAEDRYSEVPIIYNEKEMPRFI